MNVRTRTLRLTKLHPLSISRGTSTGSYNLFVIVEEDGVSGIGECAPGTGQDETLAPLAGQGIQALVQAGIEGLSIHRILEKALEMGVESAGIAALDGALWDLTAKQAGMPLYRLLGLSKPVSPTSVTIGINPPERMRELVADWLDRSRAKVLKLKLGSPDGIEADQAMYEAARKSALVEGVGIRVDANGGWKDPNDAIKMIAWLAERGCDYVEQPLPVGMESELPAVFKARKLPIFVDECVRVSRDVPKIADRCDGVNVKLMKTGGISEALRVVATCRAHGLKLMIGCMGESSVGIAMSAAIASLFDHIDLDSHMNLDPDPGTGLKLVSGVVMPSDRPGHGAWLV